MTYPNTLSVSPAWVSDHLNDETVVVLDVRAGTSLAAYAHGHLPSARPFSVPHCKSAVLGTPDCLDVDALVMQLESLGVEPHHTIVLYDEQMSQTVTFGFWALEYVGQCEVRCLEGGFKGWKSDNFPVTTETEAVVSSTYPVNVQHSHRLLASEGLGATGNRRILDVRGPQEYHAAHIADAVNCDWTSLVEDPATLQFLPADALAAKFAALGITPHDEIVTYCRSGARASVVYMALRLMGWERLRLYDGSMNDWLLREYPIVTGN